MQRIIARLPAQRITAHTTKDNIRRIAGRNRIRTVHTVNCIHARTADDHITGIIGTDNIFNTDQFIDTAITIRHRIRAGQINIYTTGSRRIINPVTVRTISTNQRIIAATTNEGIITITTIECVVRVIADNRIITGPADNIFYVQQFVTVNIRACCRSCFQIHNNRI